MLSKCADELEPNRRMINKVAQSHGEPVVEIFVGKGDTLALDMLAYQQRSGAPVLIVPETTKINKKVLDFLDYDGEAQAAVERFRGRSFLTIVFANRIHVIPDRKAFLVVKMLRDADPDDPRACDLCGLPPNRTVGRLFMTCTGAQVHRGCMASTVPTYDQTKRFAYTPPRCTNCPGCIRNLQFPI